MGPRSNTILQVGVGMPSYAGGPAHDLAHVLRKAMVATGVSRVMG